MYNNLQSITKQTSYFLNSLPYIHYYYYYILYFPVIGICPSQFTLYAEDRTCFHYAGLLSIPMGTDYCKNLNASLIAIQSERMQDFLASIVGRRYLDLCIFLVTSSITQIKISIHKKWNNKRNFELKSFLWLFKGYK